MHPQPEQLPPPAFANRTAAGEEEIVAGAASEYSSEDRRGDCAYVFILYGKDCANYLFGIMMVAWSLYANCCVMPRVLLHTRDVPCNLLDLARQSLVFAEIIAVDYIQASEKYFDNPRAHERFKSIFTKYRVFELEQYEKVLFLDADLHVRANLDCLFELHAPAAMMRGQSKPPEGERLPEGAPVNAGVMLLHPDKDLLRKALEDITGQHPHRLRNYNSPDADYLTEHSPLRGRWASIPLEYNFQLEFERLDLRFDKRFGTVRFSSARDQHFSDEGANMPFESVKVFHFSGAKPWAQLLDDTPALFSLHPEGGCKAALGEKLVRGIAEYAEQVTVFQGIHAQLGIGEGILWREVRCDVVTLPVSPERARAELHARLPQGGLWCEGFRPGTAIWLRRGAPRRIPGAPFRRTEPIGVYLEIAGVPRPLRAGDAVRVRGAEAGRDFTVLEVREDGVARMRRRVSLPEGWQRRTDPTSKNPYYWNSQSMDTRWDFPELPEPWQPLTADGKNGRNTYYHNTRTQETSWSPPEFEEVEKHVDGLEASAGNTNRSEHAAVTVWRRSFNADDKALAEMKQVLASLGGLHES